MIILITLLQNLSSFLIPYFPAHYHSNREGGSSQIPVPCLSWAVDPSPQSSLLLLQTLIMSHNHHSKLYHWSFWFNLHPIPQIKRKIKKCGFLLADLLFLSAITYVLAVPGSEHNPLRGCLYIKYVRLNGQLI